MNRESVVREDVGASEGGGLYRAIGEGWRINLKKEAYGNPNSVYFAVLNDPGVKFYASDHLKLIRNIQRKIGRKST